MSVTVHWQSAGAAEAITDTGAHVIVDGAPVPEVAVRLDELRRQARAKGRQHEFGLRVQLVTRATSGEAWRAVDRLIGPRVDGHERAPTPGLVRGSELATGAAVAALVGSYDEVAESLAEYLDLGISHLILSGAADTDDGPRPELLLPLLERRGLWLREDAAG